ncbi:MAG: helix-turn-helix domain-containing protein [Lachnospiraceae bacterium]|nr:helix-turn-helix domain-containing protein [Lachnospiraceae bacterium]
MTISEALRLTRNESGRSQEYMAFELGVTRRTILNWESGVSEPSISQAMNWFKLVNKNPLPFLLQNTYPEMDRISYKDDDSKILASLMQIINDLPAEGVRQLMYLFFGNHGSSPRAVLQMVTAHLQTPMKDRIAHGQLVATNYEIAKRTGTLTHPEHIKPDLDYLNAAIETAKTAVENNAKEYSTIKR